MSLGLVPSPRLLQPGSGTFDLPVAVAIDGNAPDAERLVAILAPGTGLRWDESGPSAVRLVRGELAEPGSYTLVVDESGVTLSYSDDAGLVSAIATLRQLLPAWTFGAAPLPGATLTLPYVRIEDAPRFAWRGQHVDVARHFLPLDALYRLLDTMHLHKLNVLHLHLTDDQGWRFPVTSLPRLTEVASWRTETKPYFLDTADGTPHGGYYTHDQLRALVGYAAVRGIDVMPEVDLPGHVRALLAAYPEYGEGEVEPVATGYGVLTKVLHLTDETVEMVKRIVDELIEVFPSQYIHLGGDECPKDQWRASQAAAALAESRGLGSVDDLQRWFTEQMLDYVTSKGRTLAGWDEILDEGPLPGAVVNAWRGPEEVARTAAQGNDMIISNSRRLYFDYYQSAADEEPMAIGRLITWQDVLAYEPLADVPEDRHNVVRGVQGQLWAEYFGTPTLLEYMAHPRQAALAEIAWSGSGADPDEFAARLEVDLARLDARGISYRPLSGPHPWQQGGTGRLARPVVHRGEGAINPEDKLQQ